MTQTVNTAGSLTIVPAQTYIDEADALNGEIQKLNQKIDEDGTAVARIASSLRAAHASRDELRASILIKYTDPQSPSYVKTLAGQERSAKAEMDANPMMSSYNDQISHLTEIRDLAESELSTASKRHAGCVARLAQIGRLLELRAAQLNFSAAKNFGQPKTFNFNL